MRRPVSFSTVVAFGVGMVFLVSCGSKGELGVDNPAPLLSGAGGGDPSDASASGGNGGSTAIGGSGGVIPPPESTACWFSQLPPEVQPILPKTSVDDACRIASTTAVWQHPDGGLGGVGFSGDARADIVGRWVACGGAIGETINPIAHAGVEFGANGRWRLLTRDTTGALVPLTSSSTTSGFYYALGDGQLLLGGGGGFKISFGAGLARVYRPRA